MTLSTEDLERHRAVAYAIDSHLRHRDYWIHLDVTAEGQHDPEQAATEFVPKLDQWLDMLGQPQQHQSEAEFDAAGVHLEVKVFAKGDTSLRQGGTIVANPVPAFAYWTGG